MDQPIWGLIIVVLVVVPLWRVCRRAGFHPALSLVAIIPLVGLLIVAAVLALAEWPTARSQEPSER
jgi:hypothetical protein